MGNTGTIGCTPTLAAPDCMPALAGQKKFEECFDPCLPALAGRAIEPLSDQECADIALVQATIRGEVTDAVRALTLGAAPNTTAELTLRMGEPNKKGRKGRAAHVTPLMRAAEFGHEDIVIQLLKFKASTYQCDSHGWTPLCYALGAGELAIAKLIVQSPGFRVRRQKEICEKLESEILLKCTEEASQEAAELVQRIFDDGSLFDAGADFADSGPIEEKPRTSGADANTVYPLIDTQSGNAVYPLVQPADLMNGSYPYPPQAQAV